MRRLIALMLAMPAAVFAQSAFDGTWRVDPRSMQYIGQDEFSLKDGVYRCDTCVPKIEVKADGQDHKVSGSPYLDTINVRARDDHSVDIVAKKGGKISVTEKILASPDGKTVTREFTFVTEGGQQGSGKYASTRVGTPAAGAHKISGKWQPGPLDSASESMMIVTYKATSDGLTMSDRVGNSYTAKFDGKDYPYKGDPGITSVSLKKIDANTIEETDKRNGKVIMVMRLTVAPDGKTLSAHLDDKLGGRAFKWTATKQ